MKKYLASAAIGILLLAALSSCGTPADKVLLKVDGVTSAAASPKDAPLSMAGLPASGRLDLDALNSSELDRLGLGGPSPLLSPPSSPYNANGMYWSQPFSLVRGDTVQVTVKSDSPVSWFGVDWSPFDVRGILATTELDEDGRAFDPQYPARSSLDKGPNGYILTVNYKILYDIDYVLVVKNNNPDSTQRLSIAVSLKPSISLRRIGMSIPIIKNLMASDDDDMGE